MTTKFETVTCGRCCGTGNHSYNQMTGTICFKCGGSGVVLSKKGIIARGFFIQSITRSVDSVKVGDFIFNDRKWIKVISVTQDQYNAAYTRIGCAGNFTLSTYGQIRAVSSIDELKAKLSDAVASQFENTAIAVN